MRRGCWRGQGCGRHKGGWVCSDSPALPVQSSQWPLRSRVSRGLFRLPCLVEDGWWSPGCGKPGSAAVLTVPSLPSQVQAQLQLEGVAHAHPHLHPHLAAHAPYLMFPPPPFGLPIVSLAESASAAAVVAAAAKSNSKNSSIADLRLKARKHAEALGL